jgi:phosphoglycerate dehydrogenase-like enzyme
MLAAVRFQAVMRVAVLDDIHHAWEGTSGIRRLRERAEVHILTEPFGDPFRLRGFDALIANRERTPFTRAMIEQLPDVRVIAQTGNHAYHIDFEAVRERGIVVARASAGYSIGTAELAIGLAIAVMRQIPATDAAIRRGEWPLPSTPVLRGKVLGIIGLGRIGRQVAKIAHAFGMRVFGWSPHLTDTTANDVGAERRDLDDLLRESDVVTMHAPLTTESRGLLDARRIGLMKPTAFVVNTARGPLIDEAALISALQEKRIAGAGLDVFDHEPLPAGHPLTSLQNVVLTPHIGWPTDDAYQRFSEAACDVLLAYMDGADVPGFSDASP